MVKGGLGCALSSSCSARIEWINLSFTLQRTSASCLPTSRHTLAALKLLEANIYADLPRHAAIGQVSRGLPNQV
jgi:hypothetical protein